MYIDIHNLASWLVLSTGNHLRFPFVNVSWGSTKNEMPLGTTALDLVQGITECPAPGLGAEFYIQEDFMGSGLPIENLVYRFNSVWGNFKDSELPGKRDFTYRTSDHERLSAPITYNFIW